MKKITLLLILFVANTLLFSQCIDQIGYYNVNGTVAIGSIPGYMMISNGSIIDISNPSQPVLHSNYSAGYAFSIIMEEDYVYFGTEMSCDLSIGDISNINFPIQKGFIDFGSDIGGGVFGMGKNDSLLFVALGSSVCSIDITDKTNPIMLDTLFIPDGDSRDVFVTDHYAYVAHVQGLKIIDFSDPENLQIVGSVGSGYNAIDVNQNYIFLGKRAGGADVFDISDPLNPIPAFSIPMGGGMCWDIRSSDNLIYLASDYEGMSIYKMENNVAIEMAHFQGQGGQTFSVCLQDSLILLSELVTGVAILHYDSTGTVGVQKDYVPDNKFAIYPNPASGQVNLKAVVPDLLSNLSVKIINSSGVLVENFEIVDLETPLDITDYIPGVYFFVFQSKGVIVESQRVVLQ